MSSPRLSLLLLATFFVSHIAHSAPSSDPEAVFKQRIMPIFRSANPSSCVQCHLHGVALKNYILPSARDTFANLRDQGLIDLDKPSESKILKFIAMVPKEGTNIGPKVHPKLRQAELSAFRTWILAAAADKGFRNAPALPLAKIARPKIPDEVIAHSRSQSLLNSYIRNIWALRFRCVNCHSPGGEKFAKHAKEHGEDTMGWLKTAGPAESMSYLMASELIDLEQPEKSELLLKPLDVSDHGGGKKMLINDTDYVAFLSWIRDYAKIKNGSYQALADLPKDAKRSGSEIWIRISQMPERRVGDTGFLTVHARNPATNAWSEKPVAVASAGVTNNKRFGIMFQGFFMLDSAIDNPLPAGEYQLRLYMDQGKRKAPGWQAAMKEASLVGTAVTRASWRKGFKGATVVKNSLFEK
jgi:hypothetical protein